MRKQNLTSKPLSVTENTPTIASAPDLADPSAVDVDVPSTPVETALGSVATDAVATAMQFLQELLEGTSTDTEAVQRVQQLVGEAVEKKVKEKLAATSPKKGATDTLSLAVTLEQFQKMKYSERLRLYSSDRELYNQLAKRI